MSQCESWLVGMLQKGQGTAAARSSQELDEQGAALEGLTRERHDAVEALLVGTAGGNGMIEQEFVPPRKYERGAVTVRFVVLGIVRETLSHHDIELER
jgi:hypothetical protein